MAGMTRIQADEVFAVIERLLAAGEAPTHISVRQALGGRGSGPVLSKLIGRWFSEHGKDYFAKVVDERARKPVADFGAQMLEAAERAALVISEAERDRQLALDERERAADEREAGLARREEVLLSEQVKLTDLATAHERLIAELRNDKSTLTAGLAQAREDRLHVEAELAKAATSLANLNTQLSQALQDSAGATERERSSTQALDDSRRRLDQAVHMVGAFQASHAEAMAEVHRLQESEQEQRQVLRDQVAQAEKRVEQLQAQLESRATQLEEAAGRESVLEDKLAESSEALAAALRDSHALASAMAGHLRMVDQLREERDAAAGHAASLADSLAVIAANVKK